MNESPHTVCQGAAGPRVLGEAWGKELGLKTKCVAGKAIPAGRKVQLGTGENLKIQEALRS